MLKITAQRFAIVLTLLVCASLLLTGCGAGSLLSARSEPTPLPTVVANQGVSVEGRLVPAHSSVLAFATGGEIAALPVSEGQSVTQGTVLASLGKRQAADAALAAARLEELSAQQALDELNDSAALAKASAEQALAVAQRAAIDAQQALDDLDTDDFREELDDKNIAVDDAKDELDDAQDELDKHRDLDADNATRKAAEDDLEAAQDAYTDAVREYDLLRNQLDQATAARDLAQAQLDDAQRAYDDLSDGPNPDQLALAQSRLENAQAQVAAAEQALADMDLTAPYDGTVVDLNDLEVGESVAAGKPVITLADDSAWYVETRDLTELEVVDVAAGQKVQVTPDALPELTLNGTVEAIDRVYTERSGDILYTVRIRLSDADPRLRWGMTVTAEFED